MLLKNASGVTLLNSDLITVLWTKNRKVCCIIISEHILCVCVFQSLNKRYLQIPEVYVVLQTVVIDFEHSILICNVSV